ncbi:hypothetical protein F4802DRAFT_592802 [Xylaria palmicola]|nr:hypothetical protein F4802DRAFT_592802 [Xylaria palmicola]
MSQAGNKTTRRDWLPSSWLDSENPYLGVARMFQDYEELDSKYTKKKIHPRFRVWRDSEEKGFHSIQRPGPHPRDSWFDKGEHVYMTATSLDGTEEFYPVPLVEVKKREAQGWKLWKPPQDYMYLEGGDRRRCNHPQDVIKIDRPHMDYHHYFSPNLLDLVERTAAPPNWAAGMPLDQGYDEEDNITTSKQFRPPSQWKRQSYGRRITLDMVEKKDWVRKLEDSRLVKAADPSSAITISPSDSVRKAGMETFELTEGIKPLYEVLEEKLWNKNV